MTPAPIDGSAGSLDRTKVATLKRRTFNLLTRSKFFSIGLCLAAACAAGGIAGAEEPQNTRLRDGWEFYRGTLGSIWEVWRGTQASDNVTWTPVTVPHCFNGRDAVDPDVRYYQGPGWYRTRLEIKNPYPDGRTLLQFEGAGQNAQVFIGLEKIAEHFGGYDEWTVDITDAAARALTNALSQGTVPVAILCDNSRQAEGMPSDLSDFTRYGGLYRNVHLIYAPETSLDRVHVLPTLAPDGSATVQVLARFRSPARSNVRLPVEIQIREPGGRVVGTRSETVRPLAEMKELAQVKLPATVRWSPKTPALYECTVTLKSPKGDQVVRERFGLRSFEWITHGPFKLNGERLLLRGTQYHEDHAGVGAAVPDDVTRRTFQQIKDLGANFVRLGHYQQSPLVLELCDELGLLVWEEIPWCRGGLGGARYQQEGRDLLRAMIDQHFNHPSVILWGLGNENGWPGDFEQLDPPAIRAYMSGLNDLAHQLDPSRRTCIRYCDFATEIPDVYSPSLWTGWYYGRYTHYRSALEKGIQSVPHFFHAEWGGDSHAGRFSEEPEKFLETRGADPRACRDGDWSESYIANLFDWHLKEQEQVTNLTGAAQWIFKDFATPIRPENPVPRVNQKGLVERDGTPKESYYIFQSYWADKPMLHIFGHGWTTRWGGAGDAKLVKVFSNCREVELWVNGVSAGARRRNIADYPAAGFHWDVKFKPGVNTLRAVGRSDDGEIADEIPVAYQTEPWGRPAQLTLQTRELKDGVAIIQAGVFDAKGVPCLDATNVVRFGLTGDAELLDNLGTARGSRVVQLCNGSAQISVRLTDAKAVASVASEGLPTQFLEITNAPAPDAKAMLDLKTLDRERALKAPAAKAGGGPARASPL